VDPDPHELTQVGKSSSVQVSLIPPIPKHWRDFLSFKELEALLEGIRTSYRVWKYFKKILLNFYFLSPEKGLIAFTW
jgi:hypothetical protein